MKKILLISLVCTLTACEDKPISKEYYQNHLDEARVEIIKCQKNKDENSISCENANMVIKADFAKKYRDKVVNSLK